MDNQEIINYVNKSRAEGKSDVEITEELRQTGWNESDIQQALSLEPSQELGSKERESQQQAVSNSKVKWVLLVVALLVVIGGVLLFLYLGHNDEVSMPQTDTESFSNMTEAQMIQKINRDTYLTQNIDMSDSGMSISIDGSPQPLVTNPEGNVVGVADGELVGSANTESDYKYDETVEGVRLSNDTSFIGYKSPVPGLYTIEFNAAVDELVSIDINYRKSVPNHNIQYAEQRFIYHHHASQPKVKVYFILDPSEKYPLVAFSLAGPKVYPDMVEGSGQNARLEWNDWVMGTGIEEPVNENRNKIASALGLASTSYKIYGLNRVSSEKNYVLLGETKESFFETDHKLLNFMGTEAEKEQNDWVYNVVPYREGYGEGGTDYAEINEIHVGAFFSADVKEGGAPLTVAFSSEDASGYPTSWEWDFNQDGTTDSTDQNPTYTFTEAGQYAPKLTISGKYGSDSRNWYDWITVYSAESGITRKYSRDYSLVFGKVHYTNDDSELGEVTGADPDTFEVLNPNTSYDNHYAKDDSSVYFRKSKIEGADPKTFTLNIDENYIYEWSKDKNNVYYLGSAVEDLDPSSFDSVDDAGEEEETDAVLNTEPYELIEGCGSSYGKDSEYIYYLPKDESDPKIVEGADLNSFFCRKDTYSQITVVKDKNGVYFSGEKMAGLDPETYQVFGMGYTKDKDNVYYTGAVLEGADPKTFTVDRRSDISNGYAGDSTNVYYFGKLLDLNPPLVQIPGGREYPSKYVSDGVTVYWEDEKLDKADAGSFQIIGYGSAIDKNYYYNSNQLLPLDQIPDYLKERME